MWHVFYNVSSHSFSGRSGLGPLGPFWKSLVVRSGPEGPQFARSVGTLLSLPLSGHVEEILATHSTDLKQKLNSLRRQSFRANGGKQTDIQTAVGKTISITPFSTFQC